MSTLWPEPRCRGCDHDADEHAEGPARTGGLVDWPCAFPDCPCTDYEEPTR